MSARRTTKRLAVEVLHGIPRGARALARLAEDYPMPVLLLGSWWIFALWLAYGTR